MGAEDSAQSPAAGQPTPIALKGRPTAQDSGSWVYKAEWNGTVSDKLYLEARYGDFGYYFPHITNGTEPYFFRDSGTLEITGSHQKNQNDRDRKQWNFASTYFLDTSKGSHTFKMGAEMLKELQWFGVLQGVGGNIEHVYNNGVSNQVIFRIPTATQVGGLKDNDNGHLTTRKRARSGIAVPQRHLVGRPFDGQWRRAVGSLQRLAAGAELACRYDWPPGDSSSGEDLCGDQSLHLESDCAAHRRGLRPDWRR